METINNLQKRISELSDKDLVLMVTLDRNEYQDEVLNTADSEFKRRNIPKATIDKFLRSLNMRARKSEKSGSSYVKMNEPGFDEEEELWKEANLPKETPKDIDPFIFPITKREPEPFFTKETESNLKEQRCVLCEKEPDERPLYCLVGRHRKYSIDGTIKKTKYRYQACYVPICKSCYSRNNTVLQAFTFLLWLGIGVVACFVVFGWGFKNEMSPFIGLGGCLGILIGFRGQGFIRGKLLCKKVIVATELYPRLGVPCKNVEVFRKSRSDIKPLARRSE
jgi:hypothetical protein